VLVALDNTWGAGLAFKPFELGRGLGVDVSVHALTKYPSGGGDVLMGSVITRDEALHVQIKLTHMRLGLGIAANDVELILRSLPTVALRYQAHDVTARALARWCQTRPECVQVLHPALADAPGHAHWLSLCSQPNEPAQAAGLFSVMLDPAFTDSQCDLFCDSLQRFKIGFSWGGPVSLVVPYNLGILRNTWPKHVKKGHLLRFSVGLEHADTLIADLKQAFERVHDQAQEGMTPV
jgi:cysteine-S-conjugate beta-lyase